MSLMENYSASTNKKTSRPALHIGANFDLMFFSKSFFKPWEVSALLINAMYDSAIRPLICWIFEGVVFSKTTYLKFVRHLWVLDNLSLLIMLASQIQNVILSIYLQPFVAFPKAEIDMTFKIPKPLQTICGYDNLI